MKFRRYLMLCLLALSSPLSAPCAHAAKEIQYEDAALTGQTVYYVLTIVGGAESGESWDGDSWEPYTTTRDTWDIAMSESPAGTGRFVGDLPTAVAAYNKQLRWDIYQDANDDATPDHEDDGKLAEGAGGAWNGTHFGVHPIALYNGSGFAPAVWRTTVSSATTQTDLVPANASAEANSYPGCIIVVRDNIAPANMIQGIVTSSTDTSIQFDRLTSQSAPFTIAAGDFIEIMPPSYSHDDRLDSHETLDSLTAFTVSVDNTEIIPTFVAKLGTRRDDVTIAWPVLNIREGEETPVWIDCSQLGGGRWIRSVANATSSDTGAFTIMQNAEDEDLVGVNRDHVVIWVDAVGDADDDDDDEANITCDVTFSSGQVVKAKLQLEVQGD